MKKNFLLIIFVGIMSSGCFLVQSIEPFYTSDISIEAPKKILGSWREFKLNNESYIDTDILKLVFSGTDMIVIPNDGKQLHFQTQFFKIEDQIYLDFVIDASQNELNSLDNFLAFTHSVCRVMIENDQLVLYFIDLKSLKKYLNKHLKISFKEILSEDINYKKRILITSSSSELTEMLRQIGSNKEIFPDNNKIILKREINRINRNK